ncbi:MAG TPA: DNA repair protein RecN, partial [Chitinophagales bacterium]|nr:DNA repair protein RecN [Chitinophagales bacterium]
SYQTQLLAKAKVLSEQRAEAAAFLEPLVKSMLEQVGLSHAVFQVQHQILDKLAAKGLDSIKFMISTNLGMPLGSLEQVASGGEISRIMLAIKAALAEKASLSTLIFDEIDTGISGEVALKVGRLLQKLGDDHQIICITHLPQMASRGEAHFFVYKDDSAERTISRIRPLSPQERVQEIAVMLSSNPPTTAAIENAKMLLAQ